MNRPSWRDYSTAGVAFVVAGDRLRRYAICPTCRRRFQLPVHMLAAGRCFGCRTPGERRRWLKMTHGSTRSLI